MMIARVVFLIGALAWLGGCATGSYVNIPPQKGDMALHDPNTRSVRAVVVEAINKSLEDRPIKQTFQVVLPAGTKPETYAHVLPKISEYAMWSSVGEATGVPQMVVQQIRIRSFEAEVDLLRPIYLDSPQASRQTVTVYLQFEPMAGWYATRLKEWRSTEEVLSAPQTPVGDAGSAPYEGM